MLKAILTLVLVLSSTCLAREIRVTVGTPAPQIDYALDRLEPAFQKHGDNLQRDSAGSPDLRIRYDQPLLGSEGFAITRETQGLLVSSGGVRGAMYGVLGITLGKRDIELARAPLKP